MKDKIRIVSGQGFWEDLVEEIYPELVSGSQCINKKSNFTKRYRNEFGTQYYYEK
jgi:hypothetical protein